MSVCIGKDMGCRCQTCDSMLDCAHSPPAAPELPDHSRSAKLADVPLEHRAFCVYCGLGVGFDEDACCSQCGNGVESLGKLRSLLATQGLTIVDAKDRAVLASAPTTAASADGDPGMSAKDDDDREIAQLVRNCWNPATGVHVYGGVLAKLSELCARSFVRVPACKVEGCTVLAEHEHRGPFVMAPTKLARCVEPEPSALPTLGVPQVHHGRQRSKRDQRHNLWRVYTFDEKREEVTHARYCEEHEAAQVDAGFWVDP